MSSKSQQELSLIAKFDDLNRMLEALLCDEIDDQVRALLGNCEKQRCLVLLERNELNELRVSHDQLLKKMKSLEATLKHVREAFKKELGLREKVQAEREELLKKMNQVKEYLVEEDNGDLARESKSSLKEILSAIELHKLTTVVEEEISTSDKSLSDIEYSKSDDNIIDDNIDEFVEPAAKPGEVFENADDFSILNDTIPIPDERLVTPIKRTQSTRSGASVQSKMSALSETLIKQRHSNQPNELRVGNRQHQFVTKKVFKPEKCCVCAINLKFCSSGYHCRDCRAICHMTCKEGVPLPCIPYVSRANIGKQGRLILVSDFVQSNCKPCVPALVVHCLNEIESRGLKEVGIYRICASEKEVRELKEKILKSKHGIPQLADKDVHVLCNVVKRFLNQLDEALISRIAWRDFVEAVKLNDLADRQIRIKEAVLNLPNANRDTLAFLMLHLRRVVAEERENKMSAPSVCKVFGPTVVGYSMKDPPAMQITEENKKQLIVVEYLLNLEDEFWQSILDMDINPLNMSMNPGDMSMFKSPENVARTRPSIGGRLCGGRVGAGTITPLKNKRPNKSYTIKPMF